MASARELAESANRRARKMPAAAPPANRSIPVDEKLDLLWAALQSQMLALLTHGIDAPYQRRAFDKLGYLMKQYGKLRRERAEHPRGVRPAEPDAEELAAVLDKLDRRIDELAEDRFKKLAGGEFLAPSMDAGGPGMDDSRQAQADA